MSNKRYAYLRNWAKSIRHGRGLSSIFSEHIRQNIVYTNVTMHRKQNITDHMMFSMYVIAMNYENMKM